MRRLAGTDIDVFDLAHATSACSGEFDQTGTSGRPARPLEWTGTQTGFARNRTIFCEGEDCTHVYFVVRGAVRICGYLRDGRRQISDFVFPGDCFGFTNQSTYSHTAEAACHVVVRRYAMSKVLSEDDNLRCVRAQLVASLSHRLLAMQDHLLMLGRQTSQERIATFLLMLFRSVGGTRSEPFDVPMGRRDIADYLGLTIETVCRELTRLKRRGIIDLPSVHQLAVMNMTALQSITGNG